MALSRRPRHVIAADVLEQRTLLTAYIVDTLADTVAADGHISLREAIQAANTNTAVNEAPAGQGLGVTDAITFAAALPVGTITLGGTALSIAGDLTITGPGASRLAINANHASRVLEVASGVAAEIRSLTVTGGRRVESGFGPGGGGIENRGTLTVADALITGNTAFGGFGGGGISNSGTLTVVRSTVAGNVVERSTDALAIGGGISSLATLVVRDSTISGNSVTGDPASISSSTVSGIGGGIFVGSSAKITNTTISGNRASADGGGLVSDFNSSIELRNVTVFGNQATSANSLGGGLFLRGAATLYNTIVAGNLSGDPAEPDDIGTYAGQVSGSNSLIGDRRTAGTIRNGNGNIVGIDWRTVLDPVLRDNGGPTKTHRLLPGSRAIDAGNVNFAYDPITLQSLTTDQRGGNFARTRGGQVDIGAFEAAPADDLVAFLAGGWYVGASTGSAFVTTKWAQWSTPTWDALAHGDFDGDGNSDVLGLLNGQWYVGHSIGTAYTTSLWGKWANAAWDHVLVGDLNGDGKDDIAAELGGLWYGALSTGTAFGGPVLLAHTADAAWDFDALADVTGDGKADLVLLLDGRWYVARWNGTAFDPATEWAHWADAAYQLLMLADLDADGKADLVAFIGGEWYSGLSTGAAFGKVLRAKWSAGAWADPVVGDFDGDGRPDLAARLAGEWWVGLTAPGGGEASRARWATWNNVAWQDVRAGDFDGDGRTDLAGRAAGEWYVARSGGPAAGFVTTLWGRWSDAAWQAVAARDATGLTTPAVASALSNSSVALTSATIAPARKTDDAVTLFWSKATKDDAFADRLLAGA